MQNHGQKFNALHNCTLGYKHLQCKNKFETYMETSQQNIFFLSSFYQIGPIVAISLKKINQTFSTITKEFLSCYLISFHSLT